MRWQQVSGSVWEILEHVEWDGDHNSLGSEQGCGVWLGPA